MRGEYNIEACSGQSIEVKKGEGITVIDLEGKQVVDFFAVALHHPSEFLSTGVTIDCNDSLKLKVGDTVYTNLYRPMFTVLSDDVGEHDLIHPCCGPEMYDYFYHNGQGHPNCNECPCDGYDAVERKPLARSVSFPSFTSGFVC